MKVTMIGENVSDVLQIKINVTNDDDNFFNSYDEKYIHLLKKLKGEI